MRPFLNGTNMDLLTAVNRIMPKLGEHPVTSIDVKHPTLAILLPLIDTKLEDLTIQGLWFNTTEVTLYQDAEGGIAVPLGTLSFTPHTLQAVVRGSKLFNAATSTYVWTEPVKGILISRLAFNELPESMAGYVWYSALVDAYVTDIGMAQDVKMWMSQAQLAESRVMSEHLRNVKYTTKKSPRYARLRQAMRA